MSQKFEKLGTILLSNWGYKLISFVLALILWTVLLGRKDVVLTQEMRVEFLLNPTSQISNRINQKIRVQLTGSSINLRKVDKWQESITIDLSGTPHGWNTVKIEKEAFELPLGVRLQSFSPQSIKVHIGKKQGE